MGRIPEDILQSIRDRVDLVDLISRFVSLKKSGRNFLGLCPFHQEKTPSFHVHVERQIYHCFGCNEGGNAFSFLMKHENLTFPEAARSLAAECGIEIQETDSGERGLAEQLLAATQLAQDIYLRALAAREGEPARRYLAERGLSDEDIERFGIGFAPARWDTLVRALEAQRIDTSLGARAGLLAERDRGGHYDRLRGRISFPIHDARGRVVAFGGRALGADDQPKYLNTAESPVYRKREALYGLHEARDAMRKRERAIIVEGYFDRIAMHRAGLEEAVATCGTSLTSEHAKNLRRRVRHVVLLFDGDAAGERAVESALRVLLPEGLRVSTARLPAGQDPDDLLEREGADVLRNLVNEAPFAIDAIIQRAVATGCSTPWEKADAVAAVVPHIALIGDDVERSEFANRLALATDTNPADVARSLRAAKKGDTDGIREALPVQARHDDPRLRWALHLAAALLVDAGLAAQEHDELLGLIPAGPARDLVTLLFEEAASGDAIEVASIDRERCGSEAYELLLRIASEDRFEADPDRAAQAFVDVRAKLVKRDATERSRELTRRLASSEISQDEYLAAKQRELERRRGTAHPC